MSSAPEVAEAIASLGRDLSVERQREIGLRWVDRSVRVMLVDAFAKAGEQPFADGVGALAPVDSLERVAAVEQELAAMRLPMTESAMMPFAAFFALRARTHQGNFTVPMQFKTA